MAASKHTSISLEDTDSRNLDLYCGCQLYVDDARDDFHKAIISRYQPTNLIRSWYRWGQPPADKAFKLRSGFVSFLEKNHINLGGGDSLSVVNSADIVHEDFSKMWLTTDIRNSPIEVGDKKFGTLTSPEFRSWVISRVLEQVQIGARELHFGEANGEIHFDDWTIGIKGDFGFIQWIRKKYRDRPLKWWNEYLGPLGKAIAQDQPVDRLFFEQFNSVQLKNFQREWGREGSWHGTNTEGKPAFLAELYTHNLDLFMEELRRELKSKNYSDVKIDIWGFADWMANLTHQPDAWIASPPDERQNFSWSVDPNYAIEENRQRMKDIMVADVKQYGHVIYMIDHPKPFSNFVKLSDERQAYLMRFLADLSFEIGANFVVLSYSENPTILGPRTANVLDFVCKRANRERICPTNLR